MLWSCVRCSISRASAGTDVRIRPSSTDSTASRLGPCASFETEPRVPPLMSQDKTRRICQSQTSNAPFSAAGARDSGGRSRGGCPRGMRQPQRGALAAARGRLSSHVMQQISGKLSRPVAETSGTRTGISVLLARNLHVLCAWDPIECALPSTRSTVWITPIGQSVVPSRQMLKPAP